MRSTDMIAWHARGTDSSVADYYAEKHEVPDYDAKQSVSSSFVVEDDGRITFTSKRKLDTNDSKDFVVRLNKEQGMIWGVRARDSRWS